MPARKQPAEPDLSAAIQRLLDAVDLIGAMRTCQAHVAKWPNDPGGHRHLAQLLSAANQFAKARRSARRACELTPQDPRCWSDLGRVSASEGVFDAAARCFAKAVELDPQFADGWHNLGCALKNLHDRDGAFHALKRALLLEPTRAHTYLSLGNLLIRTGQFDDAVECFERAARHDPNLAQARSRLAQQLSRAGYVKRAERLFRQSVGLDPDHVQGWLGLGRTLEDIGDAENALACYDQVLARQPHNALALGQYLGVVRSDAPAHVEQATAHLRAPAPNDEAKALIGYGLAKYHDRRRNYAGAADAGLVANASRRRAAGTFDRAAQTQRVDRIIGTYTSDFFRERTRFGVDSEQPVFIVGLPRSGTTLTEQILSSHPRLHGAGELPDLARVAGRCLADDEELWQAAARLDAALSRERASEYLKALRNGAPKRSVRISDKSPLNLFQLAFVATLFPKARVVHCRRDVRDNALSIWMENFSADQRYATDFEDLAHFTAQYRRLMAHWRIHLPLPMLELRYEDTVADLEAQARKLCRFLDVDWDPRCLDFHASARAVQTPSRWQVREPVYTRSVERWRNYSAHLPQLVSAF